MARECWHPPGLGSGEEGHYDRLVGGRAVTTGRVASNIRRRRGSAGQRSANGQPAVTPGRARPTIRSPNGAGMDSKSDKRYTGGADAYSSNSPAVDKGLSGLGILGVHWVGSPHRTMPIRWHRTQPLLDLSSWP